VKVHIKNFQSIEDVSFDIPENAFTCIVGPSNIGKSALRRAFECLIYNKSEASYIRNGTKTCSIEVTFADDTSVKWYRNKKTAGYIINGDDFTKLAGTVPEALTDKGFKELVVNKDKYQVQIASQFNNIFLLNQTGGKVTEVLSNLGNLNRIIKSNKACLSDLKANKSRLNIRREDIVSAKEKLKSYVGLDEQRHQVDTLKNTLKEIKEMRDTFHKVKQIELSLNKAVSLVKILRPSREIALESFDLDTHLLSNLKKLFDRYTVYSAKLQSYSKLSDISEVEFNLKEEHSSYLILKKFSEKLELAKNKVTYFKDLPNVIPDIAGLDVSKFEKLNDMYCRVLNVKKKVLDYRSKLKTSEDKLITLEKERDDLHKSLGVCPLCDKEF